MRSAILQLLRLGILIAIVWMIREHQLRIRIQGDKPITVNEVQAYLPQAHRLIPDSSPRAGLQVMNDNGVIIGYAARTMPQSRDIVGYSGPTDALIVSDSDFKILGITIRHSYDTPSHVEDVISDYLFMESWNGKTWQQVADITDLKEAGIYGVSGATRTSEALALSISKRVSVYPSGEQKTISQQIHFRWQDAALILVAIGGTAFAFLKHPKLQRWSWMWSIAVFIVLGFVLGDLLALALFLGWAESGIPWRMTPGLVILALSALLIPWATRQPVYCQFICPHGHAQRWLMKVLPARISVRPDVDFKWSLKWIAPALLVVSLISSFLLLPVDPAGLEPFDAYLLQSAAIASIIVAVISLIVSLFIPMAYCKYACPTGWILDFLRRRSGKNKIGINDAIGLTLLFLSVALYCFYDTIHAWMVSP